MTEDPRLNRFVYQLAPGTRGGVTNQRAMQLNINGKNVKMLQFPATGGWSEGDWREIFAQVELVQGENVVHLATTGQEGPNFDSMEGPGCPGRLSALLKM